MSVVMVMLALAAPTPGGTGLLGLLVSVLAVLAAIGSGAAFLTVGQQRGTVQALRDDRDDRDRRIVFLEGENSRISSELAGTRHELGALAKVVTGEAHWLATTDVLATHHESAMRGLEANTAKLDQVLNMLGDKRASRT